MADHAGNAVTDLGECLRRGALALRTEAYTHKPETPERESLLLSANKLEMMAATYKMSPIFRRSLDAAIQESAA